MIDLHTHTNASDGLCTPAELVRRAARAGVTVLAVTDHDTVAGSDASATACAAAGISFVPGIEITASVDSVDIHVLGYFIDVHSERLLAFLVEQRRSRVSRMLEIIARLASLGIVLDADAILQPSVDNPGRAPGRPWIARALVSGGHVATTDDAFDRWLGRGKPAFVPRTSVKPSDVFARLHDAGGVASLAHPGLLKRDDWIAGFAAAGLDALEAYHSEHDGLTATRYLEMAARLGLAVSGGSDYHGDLTHGSGGPGSTSLPREQYEELVRLKPETGSY